ncbi:proteasome maturation protein-like [Antedon mediterranea]|uniref:proteasome maturation protein-like n=1 Tax=Antedon mediterranea TaxID=105859 RepID=UPI003AF7BB5B
MRILLLQIRERNVTMNFGYPSLRPTHEGGVEIQHEKSNYGVPDVMTYGISDAKSKLTPVHPLEYSEKHYDGNQDELTMRMLRNTQGLHAPLKLRMEKHMLKQIPKGPCIASTNIGLETLTGEDLDIDVKDVYNAPEDAEVMGHPQAMMEKQIGLI